MVKMKLIFTVLLSFIISIATIGVQAAAGNPVAKITNVTGRVLVNQGEDYIVAQPGMTLNLDDRVITMDSSEVTIFYPEPGGRVGAKAKVAGKGCEVRLPENSQMVVESEEDCIMGAIISSNTEEGAVIGDPPPAVATVPAIAAAPIGGLGLLPIAIFAMPAICAATDCLDSDPDPGIAVSPD